MSLVLAVAAIPASVVEPAQAQTGSPVLAWGRNNQGQLGDGSTVDRATPGDVVGLGDVSAVGAGGEHGLAVGSDGTVWAWGQNTYGQLGDGTSTDRSTPVQVAGLANAVQASGGLAHSVALTADGTVWAWGLNSNGQLGDGSTSDSSVPVAVVGLSDVVEVAAGGDHVLALSSDGTVWSWGKNQNGQLGDGSKRKSSTPVQVSGLTDVVAIGAGDAHSLAVRTDGTVWSWGDNFYGQLGDGTSRDRNTPVQVVGLTGAVQVAAGAFHSLAVLSDGAVWGWGHNAFGQLGDGSTGSHDTPVQATIADVVEVDAGSFHTVAVTSDSSGWSWGYNAYGQLGDGSTAGRAVPVQVAATDSLESIAAGTFHTFALKAGQVAPSSVTITDPTDAAVVFATATVTATVTPQEAEGTVDLLVDGTPAGSAPIAGGTASIDWDTTGFGDGTHQLTVLARDVSGSPGPSTGVTVEVANSLSSHDRITTDYTAGVITAAEYAEYGLWAVMSPGLLPERYGSAAPVELETGTPAALQYLSVWDQLTTDEQLQLEDFVTMEELVIEPGGSAGLPLTLAVASPFVPAGPFFAQTASGGLSDCDEGETVRLWEAFGKLFRCRTDVTGLQGEVRFQLYYTPAGYEDPNYFDLASLFLPWLRYWSEPVDPTDDDANGVPDVIDEAALSLAQSHTAYGGTALSPGLMNRIPDGPIEVAFHDTDGCVLPKLVNRNPLVQVPNLENFSYPERHELFHRFQYEYLETNQFLRHLSEANWWMEATAEWAAHQVADAVGPFPDPDPATPKNEAEEEADLYARNLSSYLDEPEGPINAWDGLGGSEQYGAFIVAEYFEERFGPEFIEATWEQTNIWEGRALQGIGDVLAANGSSWSDVLPAIHRAEYLLASADGSEPFLDQDRPLWRTELYDEPATYGEANVDGDGDGALDGYDRDGDGVDDQLGVQLARPARVSGSPILLEPAVEATGAVFVERGGTAYVDLIPPVGAEGVITVDIDFQMEVTPPDVHVQLLPTVTYPELCQPPIVPTIVEAGGTYQTTAEVPIGSGCQWATLVIGNGSVTESAPVVSWSAVFAEETPVPIYGSNILTDPGVENHIALTGGGPNGDEIPWIDYGRTSPTGLVWSDLSTAPLDSSWAYAYYQGPVARVLTANPRSGSFHLRQPAEEVFEIFPIEQRTTTVDDTSSLGTAHRGHYTAIVDPGDRYSFTVHAAEALPYGGAGDLALGIGVVFFDQEGNYVHQNYRTFDTTDTYAPFNVSGSLPFGTERYALAFVENRLTTTNGAPEIDLDDFVFALYPSAVAGTTKSRWEQDDGFSHVYGDGGVAEARAQSFTLTGPTEVGAARVRLVGYGAADDSVVVDVVAALGQTPLVTSRPVSIAGLPAGLPGPGVDQEMEAAYPMTLLEFPQPVTLDTGQYWLVVRRTGPRDDTNRPAWRSWQDQTKPYPDGSAWSLDDGVWTENSLGGATFDFEFELLGALS